MCFVKFNENKCHKLAVIFVKEGAIDFPKEYHVTCSITCLIGRFVCRLKKKKKMSQRKDGVLRIPPVDHAMAKR